MKHPDESIAFDWVSWEATRNKSSITKIHGTRLKINWKPRLSAGFTSRHHAINCEVRARRARPDDSAEKSLGARRAGDR
jgi:hypothetical protein